ncbi:hypothetical protein T11_7195 [Trichinella zimbabwensis]|uniref:Uncharacterized protein n=1 Tax=Trichinella zimbabwensis TaxID=268475 RepID=A0A0V1GT77_9BILA|nr:hypothetical protein T11_7195 [Trichinella zimbabwensis]
MRGKRESEWCVFRFAVVRRSLACFNETNNIQFKSPVIWIPIHEALKLHEWNVSVDASSLIAGGQSIESVQEAKVALNEPVIEKEKHSGHENVLDSNTWLRSFLLNEGIYYAFSAMILLIAPHIMSGWAVYVKTMTALNFSFL